MKRYFRELIVTIIFCGMIICITGATVVKKVVNAFQPKEEMSDVNKGHEVEKEKSKKTDDESNAVSKVMNGFTDDLAGKEAGAKAATKVSKAASMGISIESTQVLLGKDDWLFYKATNDGDPIADYQGNNHYTEEQMASIASQLENESQIINNTGCDFYVMSIPNKENVYSEYMPDSIERYNDISKTDEFMEYLQNHSSVKVINTKPNLLKGKDKYQDYYSTDTHFNQIGSFIACQDILEAITGKRDSLKKVKFDVVNENYSGDLAALCEMQDVFNEDTQYSLDVSTIDPSVKSDKKILIIGDSFADEMKGILLNYFADVTTIGVWSFDMSAISTYQPDVVIWENAERYTDRFSWINITQ